MVKFYKKHKIGFSFFKFKTSKWQKAVKYSQKMKGKIMKILKISFDRNRLRINEKALALQQLIFKGVKQILRNGQNSQKWPQNNNFQKIDFLLY